VLTPGKIYKSTFDYGLYSQVGWNRDSVGWIQKGEPFLLLETKRVYEQGWREYIWIKIIPCNIPVVGWIFVYPKDLSEVSC
jgi:hypothetical protein